MHKQSRISSAVVLVAMTAAVCSAQSVTSAHSGTLHYFEGDVSIDGAAVQSKVGKFSEIKEQGTLRTGQGRAEVLLTPGVFLRIGENSAIKMLDNRLVSTRVDILSGTVIVESDDTQLSVVNSPVTLIYKDYEIQMIKHGLLEITADPAEMRVYKGEAVVTAANNRATVKEGRLLPFSAGLLTEKFNDKVGDDLFLWARDRSQSISTANMSSARSLSNGGSGYVSGVSGWNGGWYFNPYFNMYTYVPSGGTFWNPWGYGFFSPGTIYNYYAPTAYWYGGGGARGTGSIGQSLNGIGSPSATRPTSLSSLRGNSGSTGSMPALGSPVRGGIANNAQAGFSGPASGGSGFAAPSAGGGGFGAPSAGGVRGGGGGGGVSAGASSGGGGHAAAAGPRGH